MTATATSTLESYVAARFTPAQHPTRTLEVINSVGRPVSGRSAQG